MNTLTKINRAKESVAREIIEKVWEITDQCEENGESCSDMNNRIWSYIKKEHLFEWE